MAFSFLSKEIPIRRCGSKGMYMGFESRGNAFLSNFCAPDGETINAQVPNIFCNPKIDTSACE